jgi:hypothetical protein
MFRCESWTPCPKYATWNECHASKYFVLQGYLPEISEWAVISDSKKTEYYNLSESAMRKKFVQLAATNLFTQPLMCLVVMIHDIALVLCALPFNLGGSDKKSCLMDRVSVTGFALIHILTLPFVALGLESMAVIGIFSPNDGRKYYSQLEEWTYMKTRATMWKPVEAYLTLAFFPTSIVDRLGSEEASK